MTTEGPLLSAVINRRPDEVVMLAALGIVFSIAVTIESPVINLLSTSTALVRDRHSYALVRRFTLHWIVLLVVVGAALAFTPLFGLVVEDLLGTPPNISRWVRPGLQILVLWPPAIAWRRFLQGVLIRFGRTRTIARGTFLRLVATAGTALGLAAATDWPGIHLAATAMLVGVVVEAIYAGWAVQPVWRELPEHDDDERGRLGYRRLFLFHLPLAGTSILTLMAQPLVTFTLTRLDDPELTLAAWPLIFQALLLLRAPAFALPEVVIALGDRPAAGPALRRFTGILAGLSLLTMLAIGFGPAADLYLVQLQDADLDVAALARLGFWLFVPLPALAVVISWMRGTLIHRHETRVVNEAMGLQLALLGLGLGIGLAVHAHGIWAAALSIQLAMIGQTLYLVFRVRQVRRRHDSRHRGAIDRPEKAQEEHRQQGR